MKSLKKLLVILLLAIVIIFSGCIGGGDGKNEIFGSGLNVISFTSLRQVDSGEQFDLDLVVQNIGDKEATNIQADLFQTSGITILNNRVQAETRLLPPDIEKGIEGEDTILSWSLQAPTLTEPQIKSLQARITYNYTSTATSNLYIVSRDELREKGENAFPTYSTSSRGPVTLSIVEMPPFKVNPGQTTANVQVNLIIENTGFGRVVNNGVRDFAIVLKGEGVERDITNECPDVVAGIIRLFGREQERSIRCSFDLPFSETAVSYIVEAGLNYTYSIDTNPLSVKIDAA